MMSVLTHGKSQRASEVCSNRRFLPPWRKPQQPLVSETQSPLQRRLCLSTSVCSGPHGTWICPFARSFSFCHSVRTSCGRVTASGHPGWKWQLWGAQGTNGPRQGCVSRTQRRWRCGPPRHPRVRGGDAEQRCRHGVRQAERPWRLTPGHRSHPRTSPGLLGRAPVPKKGTASRRWGPNGPQGCCPARGVGSSLLWRPVHARSALGALRALRL